MGRASASWTAGCSGVGPGVKRRVFLSINPFSWLSTESTETVENLVETSRYASSNCCNVVTWSDLHSVTADPVRHAICVFGLFDSNFAKCLEKGPHARAGDERARASATARLRAS